MPPLALTSSIYRIRQYKIAFTLAILSILFALLEALFSTYYGYNDESFSLFGFGIGSFIEVISAIGVASMITRVKQSELSGRSNFEKTTLRITGTGFYILVAGLIFTSIYNIYTKHKPETTLAGVIIAATSIIFMLILFYRKTRVGTELNSDAIIADANCTKVCIYMSIVLLIVSGVYELTKLPYVDAVGSLCIGYFSFKEGKECFEKAKSNKIVNSGESEPPFR